MSKGLKELKRLPNAIKDTFKDSFDIIKKELKDKEKFDNFMKRYNLNSIEELDDFFNQCLNKEIEKCSKCKELKALEIIKAINLFSVYESIEGKYYLETNIVEMELIKENYELFKEVLSYEK